MPRCPCCDGVTWLRPGPVEGELVCVHCSIWAAMRLGEPIYSWLRTTVR